MPNELISLRRVDLLEILKENKQLQDKVQEMMKACSLKEMQLREYRKIKLPVGQWNELARKLEEVEKEVSSWYSDKKPDE
jgi:hypothetical protein